MVPKNAQKKKVNKPQRVGKGKGRASVIRAPSTLKPVAPILQFPTLPAEPGPDIKKWCIENKIPVITSNNPIPLFELSQGNVVIVRQQNVQVFGHESSWAEILYEGKTGWVNQVFLDDYIEKFPDDEVRIPHPTPNPNDAQQYMILDGETKFNMCGELCVAFIVKNDIDPQSDIETVLKKWEDFPTKSPFSYSKKTITMGTTSSHLKDILRAYGYTDAGDIFDLNAGVKEHSLDPESMKTMLRTHYLIARVKSRVGSTGELVSIDQGSGRDERNHWVVVDKIASNGGRVEIYNPFPNKREEYSFNEFFYACTAPKLSGLWVIRKHPARQRNLAEPLMPQARKFEVPLDTPKPPEFKAEQYMMIDGKKKTQLCGEFSVAYILSKSVDKALAHWKKQKAVEIGELITILKAYGYYKKDIKSFSMETVLGYWKETQPKLYEHHVGNNQPTGARELISILKAYGYTNVGDFIGFRAGLTDPITGRYLPSPGRMKKMLATHFLIAGVGIDGLTGRLIRGPKGVRHWVVVEKINPVGKHYVIRHFGGNGGWVSLYNPFTNILEEYSYREFTDSMSETGLWDGLWVKRKVMPTFAPAQLLFPTIEVKGNRQGRKMNRNNAREKWSLKKMLAEIEKRLKNGKPPEKIPALLFGAGSGWSIAEISKLVPMPRKVVAQTTDAFESLVCRHLSIQSLSPEVAKVIREKSQGDLSVAVALAEALCEMGILIIGEDKQGKPKKFPLLPRLRQEAIAKFVANLSTAQPVVLTTGVELTHKVTNAIRPILAQQIIREIENI